MTIVENIVAKGEIARFVCGKVLIWQNCSQATLAKYYTCIFRYVYMYQDFSSSEVFKAKDSKRVNSFSHADAFNPFPHIDAF